MTSRLRQFASFLSGNVNVLVNVAVALLLAKFILHRLGLGGYGVVAFVLSAGSLVHVLSNALSGATARYLTLNSARGRWGEASRYLSNALAIVMVGAVGVSAAIYVYVRWFSKAGSDTPIGFVEAILVSVVISAVAGVLSTGNFARERFVERHAINSIARIAYGAACGLLLYYTNLQMWAIAVGALLAAGMRLVAFDVSFRRLLPDVKTRLELVSRRSMLEVGEFMGWMILAYCGGYIIGAGTLMVVENHVSKEDLGRYALAFNISLLARQGVGCLSAVTSPATYKQIAVENFRGATRQVEKFMFLSLCLGSVILACLFFEGNSLLGVWLGRDAPANMLPLLLTLTASAILATFNAPISVFLAGVGKVCNYGIATLLAGLAAMAAAWLLLRDGMARLVWVAAAIGLAGLVKNGVIVLVHRRLFVFSPAGALLTRALALGGLAGGTVLLGLLGRHLLGGVGLGRLIGRLAMIVSPVCVVALCLLRPARQRDDVPLPDGELPPGGVCVED